MGGDVNAEFHAEATPVVGSCIAGRSWRAYRDGTLTGVTYGQPWQATGNEAICPYVGLDKGQSASTPDHWRHGGTFYRHGHAKSGRHTPGSAGCSCGYWCYHDLAESASWEPPPSLLGVVGVVHVYGVMTRGTKGYRAQRADISALVRPSWADAREPLHSTTYYSPLSWDCDDSDDGPIPADVWSAVTAAYPVPVHPSIEAALRAIHGRKVA